MIDTAVVQQEALAYLDRIVDPCSASFGTPIGLVAMGLVNGVRCDDDGTLHVSMRVTGPGCMMAGYFTEQIEKLQAELPQVQRTQVSFDDGMQWLPEMMADDARQRLAQRRGQRVEWHAHETPAKAS